MKYFIFGEDAAKAYSTADLSKPDQAMRVAEQINDCGALDVFADRADPAEVIFSTIGWNGYTEITEDDYNLLSSLLIDIITEESEPIS